ncbi:hypothetical protein B9T31_17435 [Acinetobacter sp. ANC 4558]|uniref:hypothetical protein n=1 Tax=Acinetobacter sp. ANC 4558 TaxID=1977876 RepID=UPI000A33C9EA|nr:hypothetical protein [Acinetobacter sp. ANC 4558]OTG79080.1 hypothetical protein B9T31_17435 [Acinetobacter sp. ANC 4558]
MDKDALNLAYQWEKQFLKGWFKDQWYSALDCLWALLALMLIALRVLFSPFLIIYVLWQFKGIYKQIVSGVTDREKVRKHIKKYGE